MAEDTRTENKETKKPLRLIGEYLKYLQSGESCEPILKTFLKHHSTVATTADLSGPSPAYYANYQAEGAKVPYDFQLTVAGTLNNQIALHDQINTLKKELSCRIEELDKANKDRDEYKVRLKEYEDRQHALQKKETLSHLMDRVNEDARRMLFSSDEFAASFDSDKPVKAVVLSIDIRRSTELMLKAKNPELFALYVTSLTKEFTQIIATNFGVIDKFTGDGLLAFFPVFYSGPDALYFALKSCQDCHKMFIEHYNQNRNCFSTVLTDVGLGIGVDFGEAVLVRVNNDLTIVGTPVVYACRFSNADAGVTALNQPAYEKAMQRYAKTMKFEESRIDLKHEGKAVCYHLVSIDDAQIKPEQPPWLQDLMKA